LRKAHIYLESSSQLSGGTAHNYLENSLTTFFWETSSQLSGEQLTTLAEKLTNVWRTAHNYLESSSQFSGGTALENSLTTIF
jgi:hypothetical protein